MCGISGILLSEESAKTITEETLQKNNQLMHHRGPDSEGIWLSEDKKSGLSQTRLSIVDLDRRASQPMILDDGNIVMVFNGEIYNYQALKERLEGKYKFKSNSDTEVLGYAYREYGEKVFDILEGMFAFAIIDKKRKHVIIARDFVGQKPLVYRASPDGFFFSSEIPVLLRQKFAPAEADMSAIAVYATENFFHIPQPFSAFKGISKLKPGHFMIIKNGKIAKYERYHKFKKTAQKKEDEFEFISSIVEEMKPRDVTFSSFLSGGNDSSLVCAALNKNAQKKVDAYTLRLSRDKTDSDFQRAKFVEQKLKLNHHIVDFDAKLFLKSVETQVKNYGEPYFHITSVFADEILEEVSRKHKVIFTGAGGDEVYYGYNNLNLLIVDAFLRINKFMPKRLARLIAGKKYAFLADSSLKTVKEKYYLQSYKRASEIFDKKSGAINPEKYFAEINKDFFEFAEIHRFIDLSYISGLVTENSHSLTIQSDLVGMKNSVEIRCPFLERRIIQRGYSLKLRKKISLMHLREGKIILKKSLLKIFPRRFVFAKKIGFGVEISKKSEIINLHCVKIAAKIRKLASRPQFSEKNLLLLIADKEAMVKNFTFVMKMYALECWFEQFIDK